MRAQQFARARVGHRSTAERDHAALRERLRHRGAFQLAKMCFAVRGEDLRNGSVLSHHTLVGVDERHAQPSSHAPTHAGLARGHGADEDQREGLSLARHAR